MSTYRLSKDADRDLLVIHQYTEEIFGEDQASVYINGLFGTLKLLAEKPGMARKRPDIRPNIRSFSYKSHIILFVELSKGIGIARILHGSQDVDTAPLGGPFPDQV